jgi:hypothetical protein
MSWAWLRSIRRERVITTKMANLLANLLKGEIFLTEDLINHYVREALRDHPILSGAKVNVSSGFINVGVELKPAAWLRPVFFIASLSLERLSFCPSDHRIWLRLHSVKDIEYLGALSSLRSSLAAASVGYVLRRPKVLAKVLRRASLDFLSASDGLIQLNLGKLEAFARLADKEVHILLIKIKPLSHIHIKEVRLEHGSIVVVPDLTKTLGSSKLLKRGVPSRTTVESELKRED